MPTPKWLVIARNEYRVNTSSIRRIRSYFPYIAIGLLAVYVFFVAPAITSILINDFLALTITVAAVPLVQIILFMFFFYLILFPISNTLRELQTSHVETFLSAPLKPSDVLLGDFLGKMPFYAIAIAVITGTFTALLSPLGLDIIQNTIIVFTFVVTFLSAAWIGTVIAAMLRTKLSKSEKARDLGRGISVIIVLPLIAVMYAMIGGGLINVLVDPTSGGMIRAVLNLLPSSWGAEIFVAFVSSPGNVGAVAFEIFSRFGGLVLFFIAVLWLGMKLASRAYRLESASFSASKVKPDGFFFKTVNYIGGRKSSGTILSAIFKDYGRKLENLSWIIYVIALIAMISFFFSGPFDSPRDPLITLSLMAIPLLAGFSVGTVSPTKEKLFIYKKSPNGLGKFLKARLLQSLLVTIPIAATVMAISTILIPQVTVLPILANMVWASMRTIATVIFVLGLALVIPIFAEDSRSRAIGIMVNLQALVFLTIGLEIGLTRLGVGYKTFLPNLDPFTGTLFNQLLQTTIILLIGLVLLYLGRRKLSNIE